MKTGKNNLKINRLVSIVCESTIKMCLHCINTLDNVGENQIRQLLPLSTFYFRKQTHETSYYSNGVKEMHA